MFPGELLPWTLQSNAYDVTELPCLLPPGEPRALRRRQHLFSLRGRHGERGHRLLLYMLLALG